MYKFMDRMLLTNLQSEGLASEEALSVIDKARKSKRLIRYFISIVCNFFIYFFLALTQLIQGINPFETLQYGLVLLSSILVGSIIIFPVAEYYFLKNKLGKAGKVT